MNNEAIGFKRRLVMIFTRSDAIYSESFAAGEEMNCHPLSVIR